MWSIHPVSAKSAPGVSTPTRSAPASPNSGPISINAVSTTAVTWRNPDVLCAAHRLERSILIACCRMSGSTRRSASLPGPAAGVAGGDLVHHLRERGVEIDALRVGEADHDEQDIRELHGDRSVRLARLLWLGAEAVIDLARQLADFFGQTRHVRERRKVAFLELPDPAVHRFLRVAKAHELL